MIGRFEVIFFAPLSLFRNRKAVAVSADQWSGPLATAAMACDAIHHRSGRDSDSGTDDSRQTVFTVSEGNTDHANQYDHRKRSENCHTSATQRNSECAAQ